PRYARLGLRSHCNEADESAERDAVRLRQTRLAERALRAFGRPTEDGRLAGALGGEVRQRLQRVLVGQRLRDRERVLVGRLGWLAELEPHLVAEPLQRAVRLVQVAGRERV